MPILKQRAQKVRKAAKDRAVFGFAGGAADALALSERLEAKLEAHPGNVRRAAVELGRDWRTDRMLSAGSRPCSWWATPRASSWSREAAT